MRYAGGLGWSDIAALLGVRRQTVQVHHVRALRRLVSAVSHLGGEEASESE